MNKIKLGNIIIILIFFIINFSYSQSEAFWFPKDLPVDPMDYRFKSLQINQVEIYQLNKINYQNQTNNDSLPPHVFMKFLINYDSMSRLKSINYNFKKHSSHKIISNDKTITINMLFDSSLCHKLIMNNLDTIEFSSWRNDYYYSDSYLDKIEIKKPFRAEDAVFVEEKIIKNTHIEAREIDGLLIEKKYFYDGNLSHTLKYEYTQFEKESFSVKLLTSITREEEFDKSITKTIINYSL